MKTRKVAGLNEYAIECLKRDGTSVIERLVILLNVCFVTSMIPFDWMSVYVVPLYKSKEN